MPAVKTYQGVLKHLSGPSLSYSAHGYWKYQMRVGDHWLPPMPIALGLVGELKKYVGLEVTLMTMTGHLMAFQVDDQAFGTDMQLSGVDRGCMFFCALGGLALAIATITVGIGAVFGAIALLGVARLHWRMFAIKDAAHRIPNVTIAATPRPSGDDLGLHF